MSSIYDELAVRRRRRRADDDGTIPDQSTQIVYWFHVRRALVGLTLATVLLALVAVVLAVTR